MKSGGTGRENALDYARTASCRTTEVIALPGYGDCLRLQMDEEGYLNVSFPAEKAPEEENEGTCLPLDEADTLLSEDDPFLESDLPLFSLADEEENRPEK